MRNRLYSIIVLYNENLFLTKTYKTLLEKSHLSFMVYDNSQVAQHKSDEFPVDVVYIHDCENGGLSKAYNFAAKYAKEHKYDWLLLLDQDTSFPTNSINKYVNAINEHEDILLFAPVLRLTNGKPFSPANFYLKRAHASSITQEGEYSLSKVAPVNSGMLVNTEAFLNVGGYNNDVFLDFADFQFIERFSQKYLLFYLLNLTCIQDFSNEEKDVVALHRRFEMYCSCAKACDKNSIYDSFCYFYIVLRRTIGLIIRTRSFIFLNTFFKKYIA